jgi:hypothetical protein
MTEVVVSHPECAIENIIFQDLTELQPGLTLPECSPQENSIECLTIQIPTDSARTDLGPLDAYKFSITLRALGGKELKKNITV